MKAGYQVKIDPKTSLILISSGAICLNSTEGGAPIIFRRTLSEHIKFGVRTVRDVKPIGRLHRQFRQYASTLAEEEVGWLKGFKDPHIGRALALIRHQLGAPWSAETLAREVALSRSGFVERFSSLVGIADPISHLLAAADCEAQLARDPQDNRAARPFGRL